MASAVVASEAPTVVSTAPPSAMAQRCDIVCRMAAADTPPALLPEAVGRVAVEAAERIHAVASAAQQAAVGTRALDVFPLSDAVAALRAFALAGPVVAASLDYPHSPEAPPLTSAADAAASKSNPTESISSSSSSRRTRSRKLERDVVAAGVQRGLALRGRGAVDARRLLHLLHHRVVATSDTVASPRALADAFETLGALSVARRNGRLGSGGQAPRDGFLWDPRAAPFDAPVSRLAQAALEQLERVDGLRCIDGALPPDAGIPTRLRGWVSVDAVDAMRILRCLGSWRVPGHDHIGRLAHRLFDIVAAARAGRVRPSEAAKFSLTPAQESPVGCNGAAFLDALDDAPTPTNASSAVVPAHSVPAAPPAAPTAAERRRRADLRAASFGIFLCGAKYDVGGAAARGALELLLPTADALEANDDDVPLALRLSVVQCIAALGALRAWHEAPADLRADATQLVAVRLTELFSRPKALERMEPRRAAAVAGYGIRAACVLLRTDHPESVTIIHNLTSALARGGAIRHAPPQAICRLAATLVTRTDAGLVDVAPPQLHAQLLARLTRIARLAKASGQQHQKRRNNAARKSPRGALGPLTPIETCVRYAALIAARSVVLDTGASSNARLTASTTAAAEVGSAVVPSFSTEENDLSALVERSIPLAPRTRRGVTQAVARAVQMYVDDALSSATCDPRTLACAVRLTANPQVNAALSPETKRALVVQLGAVSGALRGPVFARAMQDAVAVDPSMDTITLEQFTSRLSDDGFVRHLSAGDVASVMTACAVLLERERDAAASAAPSDGTRPAPVARVDAIVFEGLIAQAVHAARRATGHSLASLAAVLKRVEALSPRALNAIAGRAEWFLDAQRRAEQMKAGVSEALVRDAASSRVDVVAASLAAIVDGWLSAATAFSSLAAPLFQEIAVSEVASREAATGSPNPLRWPLLDAVEALAPEYAAHRWRGAGSMHRALSAVRQQLIHEAYRLPHPLLVQAANVFTTVDCTDRALFGALAQRLLALFAAATGALTAHHPALPPGGEAKGAQQPGALYSECLMYAKRHLAATASPSAAAALLLELMAMPDASLGDATDELAGPLLYAVAEAARPDRALYPNEAWVALRALTLVHSRIVDGTPGWRTLAAPWHAAYDVVRGTLLAMYPPQNGTVSALTPGGVPPPAADGAAAVVADPRGVLDSVTDSVQCMGAVRDPAMGDALLAAIAAALPRLEADDVARATALVIDLHAIAAPQTTTTAEGWGRLVRTLAPFVVRMSRSELRRVRDPAMVALTMHALHACRDPNAGLLSEDASLLEPTFAHLAAMHLARLQAFPECSPAKGGFF